MVIVVKIFLVGVDLVFEHEFKKQALFAPMINSNEFGYLAAIAAL